MSLRHLSYQVVELILNSGLLAVKRQWTEEAWDQIERPGLRSWLYFLLAV